MLAASGAALAAGAFLLLVRCARKHRQEMRASAAVTVEGCSLSTSRNGTAEGWNSKRFELSVSAVLARVDDACDVVVVSAGRKPGPGDRRRSSSSRRSSSVRPRTVKSVSPRHVRVLAMQVGHTTSRLRLLCCNATTSTSEPMYLYHHMWARGCCTMSQARAGNVSHTGTYPSSSHPPTSVSGSDQDRRPRKSQVTLVQVMPMNGQCTSRSNSGLQEL